MGDEPTTLGERIYNERKRRGWSQERVAEHFGTNQSSASRWERDELQPGEEHIDRLAAWLGDITADEIRGMKHDLIPPTVLISQVIERLEVLDARLARLEEAQGQGPPPIEPPARQRKPRAPKAAEFTSEAPQAPPEGPQD